MKVMSIIGTRPELIKMSEIIKKLDQHTDHVFVHTGQNYDYELNDIFYADLELRKPDHFLGVAGSSLGNTIGNVLTETERVLDLEKPDAVVILGDTNSALAGIVVKRRKIPLFHLEAGNRCFDDNVPEEINRRILDHIADVNLVYTPLQRKYLTDEGVAKDRIFVMGSPMKEVIYRHKAKIAKSTILTTLGLSDLYSGSDYFLVNIHRDENTEINENLAELFRTLQAIYTKYKLPVIVSTHPRLRAKADQYRAANSSADIRFLKPFGFLDYLALQQNAKCVISDSGTIAEESAILGFPAITIRNAIERPEAIDAGSLLMTGVNRQHILDCLKVASAPTAAPLEYQVDNCSERVLKVILGYTPYINRYVWHQ